MISFKEAHKIVLNSTVDFETETVSINECVGRVLAENIKADRDFPPFDRVTKDGIAINFEAYKAGQDKFKIESIAPAGSAQKFLKDSRNCIEVMTGAMLPNGTDTVIMYEQTETVSGKTKILRDPKKGQNIHFKGSDRKRGSIVVAKGEAINTTSIGILATVGKSKILVKKLPRIAIISTGNELVGIKDIPEPFQIRSSNSISLQQLLLQQDIKAEVFHIPDNEAKIKSSIENLIKKYDVLMISGGVSKGKFDFLPKVFDEIGAKKLFHRVAQRPGKPFWFGKHKKTNTTLFSFPGNPVSTFVNYHIYFLDWLFEGLGKSIEKHQVQLLSDIQNDTDLTRFQLVKTNFKDEKLTAELINHNGSGDLASLGKANGVIKVDKNSSLTKGDLATFIKF